MAELSKEASEQKGSVSASSSKKEWSLTRAKKLLIFFLASIAIMAIVVTIFQLGKSGDSGQEDITEAGMIVIYKEAEALVVQGKLDEAQDKFDLVLSKQSTDEARSKVYAKESAICMNHNQHKCALDAWEKYGRLAKQDYNYYKTKAIIFRNMGDTAGEIDSAKLALADLESKQDLTDAEKQLKQELDQWLNDKN